jgi:hypothetical protein
MDGPSTSSCATRTLSFADQFTALGSGIGVRVATIVGGMDTMAQQVALAKKRVGALKKGKGRERAAHRVGASTTANSPCGSCHKSARSDSSPSSARPAPPSGSSTRPRSNKSVSPTRSKERCPSWWVRLCSWLWPCPCRPWLRRARRSGVHRRRREKDSNLLRYTHSQTCPTLKPAVAPRLPTRSTRGRCHPNLRQKVGFRFPSLERRLPLIRVSDGRLLLGLFALASA